MTTDGPAPCGSAERGNGARCFIGLFLAAALAFVAWGVYNVATSLYGAWTDEVFGLKIWRHNDPSGWYTSSAVSFWDSAGRRLRFVGHPGLGVSLWLAGLARGMWMVSPASGSESPFPLWASLNVPRILGASQISFVFLHVLVALLLVRFMLSRAQESRAAWLAGVCYLMSWPVLYFQTRPTADTGTVGAVLLAIVAWMAAELEAGKGNWRKAAVRAFVAGVASGFGAMEKLMLAGAVPAVVLVMLLTVPGRLTERLWLVLAAGAGVLAVMGVAAMAIDWRDYALYWAQFAPASVGVENVGSRRPGSSLRPILAVGMALSFLPLPGAAFALWARRRLHRPHSKEDSRLTPTEAVKGSIRNRRCTYATLCILVPATVVALYRNQFHYWYLHAVLMTPFVAVSVLRFCDPLARAAGRSGRVVLPLAVLAIALLYSPAMLASWDYARHNRNQYRIHRACFDALRSAGPIEWEGESDPREAIGLITWPNRDFRKRVSSSRFENLYNGRFRHVQEGAPISECLRLRFRGDRGWLLVKMDE